MAPTTAQSVAAGVLVIALAMALASSSRPTVTYEDATQRPSTGTIQEWLLAPSQRASARFNLAGTLVHVPDSTSAVASFDALSPPQLANAVGSLAPVQRINVAGGTVIDAPADEVWRVLMDFEGYTKWSPAHRQVRISKSRNTAGDVDKVYIKMKVNMLNWQPISADVDPAKCFDVVERVFYVDEERRIFIYGNEMVPSMRIVVVQPRGPNQSVFYSTVNIQSALVPLVNVINALGGTDLQRSFELNSLALKAYVEARRAKL